MRILIHIQIVGRFTWCWEKESSIGDSFDPAALVGNHKLDSCHYMTIHLSYSNSSWYQYVITVYDYIIKYIAVLCIHTYAHISYIYIYIIVTPTHTYAYICICFILDIIYIYTDLYILVCLQIHNYTYIYIYIHTHTASTRRHGFVSLATSSAPAWDPAIGLGIYHFFFMGYHGMHQEWGIDCPMRMAVQKGMINDD